MTYWGVNVETGGRCTPACFYLRAFNEIELWFIHFQSAPLLLNGLHSKVEETFCSGLGCVSLTMQSVDTANRQTSAGEDSLK